MDLGQSCFSYHLKKEEEEEGEEEEEKKRVLDRGNSGITKIAYSQSLYSPD